MSTHPDPADSNDADVYQAGASESPERRRPWGLAAAGLSAVGLSAVGVGARALAYASVAADDRTSDA